jgi:hypothetical protein
MLYAASYMSASPHLDSTASSIRTNCNQKLSLTGSQYGRIGRIAYNRIERRELWRLIGYSGSPCPNGNHVFREYGRSGYLVSTVVSGQWSGEEG